MFWNTLPTKESDISNKNKLKELNQLKMKAQTALAEQNKIIANIWAIKYQLTSIALNGKTAINKELLDKKNKLEEEKKTLEVLLKENFSNEKINLLYDKITDIEKELDGNFNREEPYFIYELK